MAIEPGSATARLKVMFLPAWYPSSARPTEGIFIQDQARAVAANHDVAVLLPGLLSVRNLWARTRRESVAAEAAEGCLTVRSFAQNWVPWSARASSFFLRRSAFLGFMRLLEVWGRPDLIHAHVLLPAGWIAVAIGRRFNIPVVLTEHTSPFSSHLRTRWMRSRVHSTLVSSRAVVALSPSLAADIQAVAPEVRVSTIGEIVNDPGVSAATLRAGGVAGPVRIAFVGGLREQKGLSVLLEAIHQIDEAGVGTDLLIAGDGPLRAKLEEEATVRNIAHRCRFLGELNRTEVFELLLGVDLLVAPSLHETFCLAAAEALACGRPVVVTRCGGPESYVTSECGCVVEPRNPSELARGILRVVARSESFDRVAMHGRILSLFGVGEFLRRIGSLYQDALVEGQKRNPA